MYIGPINFPYDFRSPEEIALDSQREELEENIMNLCSHNHDEVCFEDAKWVECPVCYEMAKRDETIEQLRDQIDELKDQLKDKETP